MSIPPVAPLRTSQGRALSYFEYLVVMVHPYMKEEGLSLNFSGYQDVLCRYSQLREDDVQEAWELSKELNAWAEYFSSVANLVQRMYLDAEADKLAITSLASVEADAKKVANGERLANQDARVIAARKRRNILKAFYDELEAKVRFLERAHYHCKVTYEYNKRQGFNKEHAVLDIG
ncbi:UNVERIFIED_ORG: hypothetical protein BDK47_11855 [Anoxybacillus amylolyticus]